MAVAAQGKKRFTWPRLVRGRLADPRLPASGKQRRAHGPSRVGHGPRAPPSRRHCRWPHPESTEGGHIGLVSDWVASTRFSLTHLPGIRTPVL